MNAQRRKRIMDVCDKLSDIMEIINEIADEEEECYNNLPESIQYSDRGERMNEIFDALREAADSVDDIIYNIQDTLE